MRETDYIKRDSEYYFTLENALEKRTIGEMPAIWAEKFGSRTAFVADDEEISYNEMSAKTDLLVKGFLSLGIKKGDHVIVQLPNTASFIYTMFALEKIGALPVMTLPAQRVSDLRGIFETVSPVAYIIPESYLGYNYSEMAKQMKEITPSLRYIICDGEMEDTVRFSSLFLEGAAPEYEKPAYNDIAHLLLSGGTTGTPKLIPRCHAEYLYNSEKAAERCGITEDDVLLIAIPVSHNFSLSAFGILGVFLNGGTVVLCPYPSVDEMLPMIEDCGVTALQLVPVLVSALIDTVSWDDSCDISSLRIIVVGGSVFEKELAMKVEPELDCKLVQVFGTAEGIICMTSLDDSYGVSASCQGKPISEFDEIRIVDEGLNDLPQGELGEFIERGAYTIHNYYMASDEVNSAAFTPSGFYRTGDKAKIDENGNLVVVGRIKEQINKGGEKIMPSEVEENLCKADFIRDAAVVGVPDEVMGSRICAFIISDRETTLEEVRAFLKSLGMADYKMPDSVYQISDFPLTKVGKVDKKALEEQAKA